MNIPGLGQRAIKAISVVILSILTRSIAEAKNSLAWEIDIPNSVYHESIDNELTRIIIVFSTPIAKKEFGMHLKSYGRSGQLVWEDQTDSCLIDAKRGNIVWINKGDEGIILDRMTGKVLKRSKKLLGALREKKIHGNGFWECADAELSQDGRYLITEYCQEPDTFDCGGVRENMVTDVMTGKTLWHVKGEISDEDELNKKMILSSDSPFIVTGRGIFSKEGNRLWDFGCVQQEPAQKDGRYRSLCRKDDAPRFWSDQNTVVSFQKVAKNGSFMLGTEMSIDEFSDGKNYIYLSNGDPTKPWRKIPFPEPSAYFSEDEKFIAVLNPTRILNGYGPPVHVSLYKTDGTMLWTKTSSSTSTGHESTFFPGFSRDKLLVNVVNMIDVYDLAGNIVKRISQPPIPDGFAPAEKVVNMFRVNFIDDKRYLIVTHSGNASRQKGKLQVWEGSIDDPD